MKKAAPFILLMVMALLVILIKRCKSEPLTPASQEATRKVPSGRNRGFDRTLSHIEYTAHAQCRMQCRHISQEDIEDIMRNGDINYGKSELDERPCPVYALQGYTRTREHLRVIFGQCDEKTKVITCYNLEQDFECHCPGDEKKSYK